MLKTMGSGDKQNPQKREPLNPTSEPLNPTIPVDSDRLKEHVFLQSEDHPLASMKEEGEAEAFLEESCVLSVEEVIRRRANRVERLSRVYRKQYWALMEEMRFKYREYYWKFGRSGCIDREEWVGEGGGCFPVPERENGDHAFPEADFPTTTEEDVTRFFGSAGECVGLDFADQFGHDAGGLQDRCGENGLGFSEGGFRDGVEGGFLGYSGENGFGFPACGFPSKEGCGVVMKSEENHFGYPESGIPVRFEKDGGRYLGPNTENQFFSPDSGFLVKRGMGDGHGFMAKVEDNEFGFAETGFPLKRGKEVYGFGGMSSENGYAFLGSALRGKESQDACGFAVKPSENSFPLKTDQEDRLVPGRIGENCPAYQEKVEDSRCGFAGCKMKPMALSCFCHSHILSDTKQQLYKPCAYVIKSGQTGPITCGKPVLRAVVPSLCSMHFQKAQKHLARSLKKAGHNTSFSNASAPKFHVIVSEYVRCIQAKRKGSDCGSRLLNKVLPAKVDLPVKNIHIVKNEVIE